MTASEFTIAATAWITAVGTVSLAAYPVVSRLIERIKLLEAQAKEGKAQSEVNASRIDQHDVIEGVNTAPSAPPIDTSTPTK